MKYILTKGVKELFSEEDINDLLRYFFSKVNPSEIDFVAEDMSDFQTQGDERPLYTMQHKNGQVIIIFPLRSNKEGRYLYLALEKEMPHLDGLHQYGGERPPIYL